MRALIRHFPGLLVLLAAVLATAPGNAQPTNCADRASIVEGLAQGFGEVRQGIGLSANGNIVEVFASAETRTWTIIVTRPGGRTCLLDAGHHFERIGADPAARPKGEPL